MPQHTDENNNHENHFSKIGLEWGYEGKYGIIKICNKYTVSIL